MIPFLFFSSFPPCCIASPEQGCKPLSRLLGRGTAHGGQDLEDFSLLRQRELQFPTPREYSLTFQLLIGKRELEFYLLLLHVIRMVCDVVGMRCEHLHGPGLEGDTGKEQHVGQA